jgi:hypothetical protein
MMIPSRRKLAAAALIIAGIGAFLVPFLLHSPTTEGTSPYTTTPGSGGKNPTTPSGNGSPTVTPSSSGGDKDSGGSGGSRGSTATCSEDKAKDPSPADNGEGKHNGNAYGVLAKQLDTTVALVKAMGTHNAAFHSQHDTKTDNDTVHAHQHASSESSNDHDSSCAEKEETNDD